MRSYDTTGGMQGADVFRLSPQAADIIGHNEIPMGDTLSLLGAAGVLADAVEDRIIHQAVTSREPGAESEDGYRELQAIADMQAAQRRAETAALGGPVPTSIDEEYALPDPVDYSKPYSPFD